MHFMNPIGLLGLFFENDLLILHPFSSSRSAGQHEAASSLPIDPAQPVSQSTRNSRPGRARAWACAGALHDSLFIIH